MKFDVTVGTVSLLCLLVIPRSLQTRKVEVETKIEEKEIKPPTYNAPPNEVVRKDRDWVYLDSPLNQIPIPRAPTPTFGEVTPRPQIWHRDRVFFVVSPNLSITVRGPTNYILSKAVTRYEHLIGGCEKLSTHSRRHLPHNFTDAEVDRNLRLSARWNFKDTSSVSSHFWGRGAKAMEAHFSKYSPYFAYAMAKMKISSINLEVRELGDIWPSAEMDESYSLMVVPSGIMILANEVWGALRGLETLSQLLWCSPTGSTIFINRTFIEDRPTFSYRGLHLDTSRHYISKRKILMNLEAMAFNKLNVFHWHITDDQSFPFVSKTFPELSQKAAYHPQMVYTHDDVREIIEFARVRGIRVIPEFDIPGHTRSWSLSHPEIFAKCYEMDSETPFYGGLDPSKNETLELLAAFFKEIVELFPDNTLHLGFDEVEFSCWSSNPAIQKYMQDNRMESPLDIFKLFTVRLLNRIQQAAQNVSMTGQKRFIFWQEAFENGLKVPNNSLIHLWKDVRIMPGHFGLQSIVSRGFYLDSYTRPSDWIGYYENSVYPTRLYPDLYPEPPPPGVVGGEACMWIEWQTDETVISRIWPITSAIAERFWYYDTPNSDEFGPRLEEQRCRLLRRGVPVGVASGPGMCPLPSSPSPNPLELGEVEAITIVSNSHFSNCLEMRSVLVLIFCGLVAFGVGYFAGRLGLGTQLPLFLKSISTDVCAVASISRNPRLGRYLLVALFTCLLTITIALLLSFTLHSVATLVLS